MKTILILDTETSGLDPAKDHLIEVGLVRWSVEHRTTIACGSWLVIAPENPAEPINGIPPAILAQGMELGAVKAEVAEWASDCDAVAAHGDFDRQWFPPLDRPWIDTAWDVDWPRASNAESRKVHALCLAHGLAVIDAHRALPDCQLIAKLLERVGELGHDVTVLLKRAMRPKVKVLSLAPFQEKEVVKQHGFRWNPEGKVWWRMMAPEDVAALPFRCRVPEAASDAVAKRAAAPTVPLKPAGQAPPATDAGPDLQPTAGAETRGGPSGPGGGAALVEEGEEDSKNIPASTTTEPAANSPEDIGFRAGGAPAVPSVGPIPPAPRDPLTLGESGLPLVDDIAGHLSMVSTVVEWRAEYNRGERLRKDEMRHLGWHAATALVRLVSEVAPEDLDGLMEVIGKWRKVIAPAALEWVTATYAQRRPAPVDLRNEGGRS